MTFSKEALNHLTFDRFLTSFLATIRDIPFVFSMFFFGGGVKPSIPVIGFGGGAMPRCRGGGRGCCVLLGKPRVSATCGSRVSGWAWGSLGLHQNGRFKI